MSKSRVSDYETVPVHRATKIRMEDKMEHGETFDKFVGRLLDVFERLTGAVG